MGFASLIRIHWKVTWFDEPYCSENEILHISNYISDLMNDIRQVTLHFQYFHFIAIKGYSVLKLSLYLYFQLVLFNLILLWKNCIRNSPPLHTVPISAPFSFIIPTALSYNTLSSYPTVLISDSHLASCRSQGITCLLQSQS